MTNYQSPKRFSNINNTGMTAELLKEQLDNIGLPKHPPQLPSTYDIFGNNEDSYQPSGFLTTGSDNAPFVNDLEYAGAHFSFRDLVKALAKKLTSGTAKPDLAIAYGKYFTYLGKTLTRAAKELETALAANSSYLRDKTEFDAINETFHDQLKHEQQLSESDWQAIELEETQARHNARLEERNAQLADELAKVDAKQNKLTALVQKLMKAGGE